MADTFVHVDRRPDGVAVITLDRPKANALSVELLAQLEAAADGLAADLPGAVVVTGGPKIFAAGADIAGFGGPDEAAVYARQFRAAFDKLAALPRAVIAAVAGYALGGGCELALACDLRIASEKARFGQPEIQLGLIPGAGGTQRLSRLVGAGRAKELILTGRHVDAAEAHAIGLVERVVPAGEELDAAVALAAELAAGPLVAAGYAKRAVDAGLDGPLAAGLDLEQELFVEVFRTEDAANGVRSFLDNGPGKAAFKGR
ncbi:enoyl-CoA hydratase/isomerase family protein [Acidiferrimicrobium sp. IK]|uniref:enoyl-CoA hydratase/isomerase family protein n=1 Tax=Acidiferrimicrobium sp. IK TaxID=2871700 RepID=UPI0021CAF283|nr:enoyl-CoA hydratase-related protein [Acidiferrimicrobium sp. IK]MCU4186505.1 enoyl-CoA hydratase/isomerase family protein [Acidiferrimicrobium sp. IK]